MSNGDIYVSFGADTGPLEAAFATARAQVQGLTAELNKNAREMRATGAAADSELGQNMLKLGSELSAARGHFAELNETIKAHKAASEGAQQEAFNLLAKFRQLTEGLTGLHEAFSSAAETFAAAFAIHEIAEWVDKTAEAGEHIERLSAQLGASTTEVQQLGAVAKLTGTDSGALATEFERLQLRLAETASASNPARAGLRALGIDADQFRRLRIPEQFNELAEAASRLADGVNKTAAFQALGRQFVEILPLLDRGKEGIRELNDIIERTGVVMSSADVSGFAAMQEHIVELSLAWQGFSQKLLNVLRPAIDEAIQGMSRLLEAANANALQAEVAAFADSLIAMAEGVADFAASAEQDWDKLVSSILGPLPRIETALESVAGWLNAANEAAQKAGAALRGDLSSYSGPRDNERGFDPTAGPTRYQQELQKIGEAADAARAKVRELFRAGTTARSDAAMGGELYNGPAPAKPEAGALTLDRAGRGGAGKGAKDSAEEAREAYQTEVDAARNAAMSELDSLDNLVKQHKISWGQWAKDSTAALEQEKAAIEKAAQAAIANARLTSLEKQRIANDEARGLAAIAKKEAADAAKAAEESQRAWDNFFKPFNNAVDRMVSQMTSGHQTIAQDLKKTLDSMLADVLKFFANWALHQAEMVAEKIAGDQIMQQSTAAGDIFNLGALIGQAARAVAIDAGVVAGGVAANQAPILGPAAIAEGLGAAAVVAGFAGGIGSADIGIWEVPHDQLNLIHQGELVMPAAQASAFRGFLDAAAQGKSAGGGAVHIHPTVNINQSSIDGASTAAFYRRTGPELMRGIDEAVRHGAHLGLKGLRR